MTTKDDAIRAAVEALTAMCQNLPSADDLNAAGWDIADMNAACDAYGKGQAALSMLRSTTEGEPQRPPAPSMSMFASAADYNAAMDQWLGSPVAQGDAKDAARYRWLREQHWNNAPLCAVMQPKQAVKLGHDCPALDRLDAAIDAAMSPTLNEQGTE